MADLDKVLSSVLIGLTKARQVADSYTASLAEENRRNPLLEGLGVSRVRIPEMSIEMPLMVEEVLDGRPGRLADSPFIVGELMQAVQRAAEAEGVAPPASVVEELHGRLEEALDDIRAGWLQNDNGMPKEAVSRRAQQTVREVLTLAREVQMGSAALRSILDAVAEKALAVAEVEPTVNPALVVNVLTADVKEQGTPTSVVRLRIVLKEEGLEWTSQRDPDGVTKHTLTVE